MAGPGERAAGELSQYGEHARLTPPASGFSSVLNEQRHDEGVWQVEGGRVPADDCGGLVLVFHGAHNNEVAVDSMLLNAVKQDVGLEIDRRELDGNQHGRSGVELLVGVLSPASGLQASPEHQRQAGPPAVLKLVPLVGSWQ